MKRDPKPENRRKAPPPVQPGKTKEDVRNRVDYLRSELRRHNRLYYEQAEPESPMRNMTPCS